MMIRLGRQDWDPFVRRTGAHLLRVVRVLVLVFYKMTSVGRRRTDRALRGGLLEVIFSVSKLTQQTARLAGTT